MRNNQFIQKKVEDDIKSFCNVHRVLISGRKDSNCWPRIALCQSQRQTGLLRNLIFLYIEGEIQESQQYKGYVLTSAMPKEEIDTFLMVYRKQ